MLHLREQGGPRRGGGMGNGLWTEQSKHIQHTCSPLSHEHGSRSPKTIITVNTKDHWWHTVIASVIITKQSEKELPERDRDTKASKCYWKNGTNRLINAGLLKTSLYKKMHYLWSIRKKRKFLKRWEYQATWPVSWEICTQIKKATVRTGHGTTDWFQIGKGER